MQLRMSIFYFIFTKPYTGRWQYYVIPVLITETQRLLFAQYTTLSLSKSFLYRNEHAPLYLHIHFLVGTASSPINYIFFFHSRQGNNEQIFTALKLQWGMPHLKTTRGLYTISRCNISVLQVATQVIIIIIWINCHKTIS